MPAAASTIHQIRDIGMPSAIGSPSVSACDVAVMGKPDKQVLTDLAGEKLDDEASPARLR